MRFASAHELTVILSQIRLLRKVKIGATRGNIGIHEMGKIVGENGIIYKSSIFSKNISKNSLKFNFSIELFVKNFQNFLKMPNDLDISSRPSKN